VRDQIVDFVRRWSQSSEIGAGRFIGWLGVRASKFYSWRERYGRVNEHNGWIPRDFWLEAWEKQAIVNFHLKNPFEGYRRLTFMMLGKYLFLQQLALKPNHLSSSASSPEKAGVGGSIPFLAGISSAATDTDLLYPPCEAPTRCARVCQCRGCGRRLPRRILAA